LIGEVNWEVVSMTRKIILACGLGSSSAWAKHHPKHHEPVATTATQAAKPADQIQGVNPMTNSPETPAAPNKQPYVAVPGVNPM
jgi:hypothetical protein